MAVFAIAFYRGGLIDGGSGLLWAALSVAISLLIWQWFGWGVLAMILGQMGLFFGIGIYRVIRDA